MKILHARFFLLNQYFYGINFAANLLILSLIFDKFFLVLSALKRNRSMKRRPVGRLFPARIFYPLRGLSHQFLSRHLKYSPWYKANSASLDTSPFGALL